MLPFISQLVCAAASWLIGSIPFSLVIARVVGKIDLRQHGSGNVGATNVARTLGAKWGILALLLDAAKGALPVWLLPLLLAVPESAMVNTRVLCGAAAILGHMFPPWLGFRGGKGVATALGVVAVLAPAAMGWAFLAFVLTFAVTRIVSLSSMLAAATFAGVQLIGGGVQLWTPQTWALGMFSVAVPALIIVRHWPNIVRLCRGEEKPLQFKKGASSPTASSKQQPPPAS